MTKDPAATVDGKEGFDRHRQAFWSEVIKALAALYEAYCKGRIAPRNRGYDDEVDALMKVYDEWLD